MQMIRKIEAVIKKNRQQKQILIITQILELGHSFRNDEHYKHAQDFKGKRTV